MNSDRSGVINRLCFQENSGELVVTLEGCAMRGCAVTSGLRGKSTGTDECGLLRLRELGWQDERYAFVSPAHAGGLLQATSCA